MFANTFGFPLGALARKFSQFLSTFTEDIIQQLGYCSKWLTPGLSIKRWLAISFWGTFSIYWGLSNLWDNYIWAMMAIAMGIYLAAWGQVNFTSSVTQVLNPENELPLIDLLLDRRRLSQGQRIVALGGGTGLSSLLRGLKQYSSNLTAVVTVADDGGSSGRLREEFGVLPPGDIRNCLAALSQEESLLTQLFQYRFTAGDGLEGHSFGNLFLTAMSEVTGNLETAIAASSKILAVRGQVLPATLNNVRLWAELDRGQIVEGESNIAATEGKINHIGCLPANPQALPAVISAIKSSDCIILGPGSLYTSIIPNLLVPEIRDAIANAKVPRIYVCNIMTQPGETEGYTVADHIKAIDRACGEKLFDTVIVNSNAPSPEAIEMYQQENSHPVILDSEEVATTGRRVILANILDENPHTHQIRHNSPQLAQELNRLVSQLNY